MSSDISDIDEDVLPNRDVRRIHQLASKGWKTCSKGFECKIIDTHVFSQRKRKRKSTTSGRKSISFNSGFESSPSEEKSNSVTPSIDNQVLPMEKQNCSLSSKRLVLEENQIPSSSSKIQIHSTSNVFENQNQISKLRRTKNWAFNDLSNNFPISPTLYEDSQSIKTFEGVSSLSKSISNFSFEVEDIDESPVISTYSAEFNSSGQKDVIESSQSIETCDFGENSLLLGANCLKTNVVSKEIVDLSSNIAMLNNIGSSGSSSNIKAGSNASHWIQGFTSNNDSDKPLCNQNKEESEFLEGGFAEQAEFLKKRQKSLSALWARKKIHRPPQLEQKKLPLLLKRSVSVYGFVLWKCTIQEKPLEVRTDSCEINKEDILLLLKKSKSAKMLNPGNQIVLYPPWQTLKLPNVSHKFLLCTYYVGLVESQKDDDIKQSNSEACTSQKIDSTKIPSEVTNAVEKFICPSPTQLLKESSTSRQNVDNTNNEANNSSRCNSIDSETLKKISFCGRIQRIWCNLDTDDEIPRYKLLVQDSKRRFYLLHLVNRENLDMNCIWPIVAEGKCVAFSDVLVFRLLKNSKHPILFDYLRHLTQLQDFTAEPIACCRAQCMTTGVSEATSLNLPTFCKIETSPLSKLPLLEKSHCRFSCVVKVLYILEHFLYLSDLSLKTAAVPCVRLGFESNSDNVSIIPESILFIRDSISRNGTLFVDKFSLITIMMPKSEEEHLPTAACQVTDNLLKLEPSDLPWPHLSLASVDAELVLIEGFIKNVEFKTITSCWLCSNRSAENPNNENSSAMCKTCDCAIFGTNLNVEIITSQIAAAVISLELSCSTTEKVLALPESKLQSNDSRIAIGKRIGPLLCYITSRQQHPIMPKFNLVEISKLKDT